MSDTDVADTLAKFAWFVNAPYVAFLKRLGLDREFVRAEGALVFDREGCEYVDCIAGYGNLNLGHHPRRVIEAVVREMNSLQPFNWPFVTTAHARLAEKLAHVAPGDLECSLIVNSGAEAVDSALKLARLATGKSGVIAAQGAWHGFTFGALSVSEPTMRNSFGPLLDGVTHVPYGDADAVGRAVEDSTGAVIVEPIQAESGAVVPPSGYLRDLVQLCRERRLVLIFDEIKTGVGKTGRLFACEHEDAVPDILLTGKSLGGGAMPIGAVVARRKLWGTFGYSFAMSSSSAAGNAPACAAALAALQTLESERLCENATTQGETLLSRLRTLARNFPTVITGASGRGLLTALHTVHPKCATEIIAGCIRGGVLVMTAFCDKTRILIEPPLCITSAQLDRVLTTLERAVAQVSTESRS